MDTFFEPHSAFYLFAALAWLILDRFVLAHYLPRMVWLRLRMPALILHEFAHWIVALLLLAWPRISFKARELPDGVVELGRVHFGRPLMGDFGRSLIAMAPLWLYYVGLFIAAYALGQPQPFWHGIGWLGAFYICMEAAALFSWSDFRAIGGVGRFIIVVMALIIVAKALLVVAEHGVVVMMTLGLN